MNEPRKPNTRSQWAGVAALILCATMWSLNGPLIKLLRAPEDSAPGVGGLAIACYRSTLGGLLFLPFAVSRRESLSAARPAWLAFSVGSFTLMTVCFVVATTQTAAASAIALQYLSPVVVFLLAPLLLRESARWSEGIALLGALAGLAVIFFGHPPAATGPLVIAVFSGVGYGSLTVALRGLRATDPRVVVAMNFLGSGLLTALAVPFVPGATLAVTPRQFGLLALMSVVQFAAPYAVFSWALQRVEAHRASLILLLEVILNPLLTYLVVGERVPIPTLIGGPMIVLSVVGWMCLSWRNKRLRSAG